MAIKQITRKLVTLTGLTPIMFDRYSGDNKTELTLDQKVYTHKGKLVLPSLNIISFLSAQNTESATKRVLDVREYKPVAAALLSSISINPLDIPFLRNNEPIAFGSFVDDEDPLSGMYVERHFARLPKGIPNPKTRPVLGLPWSLEFDMTIYPNEELNEFLIERIFSQGGIQIGLGTYRGVYGKFQFAWKPVGSRAEILEEDSVAV
jgi:hypothetical protein